MNTSDCFPNCPQLKLARYLFSLRPRIEIKVFYFVKHWNEDQVRSFLFENNLDEENDEIELQRIMSTNKGHVAFAIVNHSCYKKLMRMKKVKIDLEVCTVEENIHPIRCQCCYRYDHKEEQCENEKICPRCGRSHRESNCQNPYRCSNCSRKNLTGGHAANDDGVCPIYAESKAHLKHHLEEMDNMDLDYFEARDNNNIDYNITQDFPLIDG